MIESNLLVRSIVFKFFTKKIPFTLNISIRLETLRFDEKSKFFPQKKKKKKKK